MLKFLILLIALALAYGSEISRGAGSSNKYFVVDLESTSSPDVPLEVGPNPSGLDLLKPGIPTMVIVHGHEEDYRSGSSGSIKSALIRAIRNEFVDPHNVILVDWSSYSKQSYSVAVNAATSVGKHLGQFLVALLPLLDNPEEFLDNDEVHLVGFNIGAHIVGIAGRYMNDESALPGRITGLDPTGKNFGNVSPRLNREDATYVEVIHTDGSGLLSNGIGTAIGYVDFFVNGGSNQPGCLTHRCSHERAYLIFADTLKREKDNKLIGYLCKSNLQMSLNKCKRDDASVGGVGFKNVKPYQPGSYRVNTRRSAPY